MHALEDSDKWIQIFGLDPVHTHTLRADFSRNELEMEVIEAIKLKGVM
jgi:hypothetical protein